MSTASFREYVGVTPGADEEWRWSIVEAKGIRPGQGPSLPEILPGFPPLALPGSMEQPPSTPVNSPLLNSTPDASNQPAQDKAAGGDPPQR